MADEHDEHDVLGARLLAEALERFDDFSARGRARDACVAFSRLVDEIDQPLLRNAETLGRLGQRGAPLVKGLPVLGIASEPDDDEEERLEHQASPTIRR